MYNINHDYHDFCYQQEYECPKCLENEELIYDAQGFLTEVIEQIYAKKEFDKELLENALDSLCCLLDVRFLIQANSKMMIEKKAI